MFFSAMPLVNANEEGEVGYPPFYAARASFVLTDCVLD